jgi:hypothetical protein
MYKITLQDMHTGKFVGTTFLAGELEKMIEGNLTVVDPYVVGDTPPPPRTYTAVEYLQDLKNRLKGY